MKNLPLLFHALAACATAQIALERGASGKFGDSPAEIAARIDEKVFDAEGGRLGIDRMMATDKLRMFFDTDRLARVVFRGEHLLLHPVAPFADEWRNPSPIGGLAIGHQMKRAAFDLYLAAWRRRAEAAGKTEHRDYWVTTSGSRSGGHVVTLAFAPRRRLMGTGTLAGDTLAFTFLGTAFEEANARLLKGDLLEKANALSPAATLFEITATCDEFVTRGRETNADRAFTPTPRVNGRPLAPIGTLGAAATLDDGKVLRFGQALAELEAALGVASREEEIPVLRAGDRRKIVTPAVTLGFAQGRLEELDFRRGCTMAHPLQPFDEDWKHPDPIGDLRLVPGMSRSAFNTYLDAWKKRATAAGKREDYDYDISGLDSANITVSLAPFRLTGNGRGIWSDVWGASFHSLGSDAGRLESLRVRLDAYNPNSRPRPGVRDPTFTGVVLEDGTELYFGQPLDEVERLTGARAATFGGRSATAPAAGRKISLRDVTLDFDNDRLHRIDYRALGAAPAPFPQLWKNFMPVEGHAVALGMTEQAFRDYLAAWETRLKAQSLERDRDWRVRESSGENVLTFFVSMAASNKSAGGAWVRDTWTLSFNPSGRAPNRQMRLISLVAMRGEISSRPPASTTQRREEARELSKQIPPIAPPPLELNLPVPR